MAVGLFAHIDLATGLGSARPAEHFGGPVAALWELLDSLSGPTEPADAPLSLVASTVAGVAAPGLARCAAVGISPLSLGVAETRAEGPFAGGLRRAGVTGVTMHGRAARPVCVVVSGGIVRVEPADDLWGLETGPATDALLARYGDGAAVAVIGPAGERRVRFASIVTGRDHPLPRLGLGAVMGAKYVKAVVCIGSDRPPVVDQSRVDELAAAFHAAVPDNPLTSWQQGVPGFGVWSGEPGYGPVANFADTTRRSGVAPGDVASVQRIAHCPHCPVDCVKVFAGAGLHQEALAMLGPNLGVADPFALNARCLQLGLDPVSLGGTLAAAGVPAADVPAPIEAIAAGGGLAEGAARVAGAAAMTSKQVELPPFDPRVQPNLGLAYAVSPFGPRYDIIEHDLDFDPDEGMPHSFPEMRRLGLSAPTPRGQLEVTRTAELMRLWSGLDALGVCLYAATPTRPLLLSQVEDLVTAVTGEPPRVLALGGLRLWLARRVNERLGLSLDADVLPDRFFTEPVQAGRYAGAVLDRAAFTAAVSELHYQLGFTRHTSRENGCIPPTGM